MSLANFFVFSGVTTENPLPSLWIGIFRRKTSDQTQGGSPRNLLKRKKEVLSMRMAVNQSVFAAFS